MIAGDGTDATRFYSWPGGPHGYNVLPMLGLFVNMFQAAHDAYAGLRIVMCRRSSMPRCGSHTSSMTSWSPTRCLTGGECTDACRCNIASWHVPSKHIAIAVQAQQHRSHNQCHCQA
jgi:hypothetical protein